MLGEAVAEKKAAGAVVGRARMSERANARAVHLLPAVSAIQRAGATSLRDMAAGLNAKGIPAPRGGEWSPVQVQRLLARMISPRCFPLRASPH